MEGAGELVMKPASAREIECGAFLRVALWIRNAEQLFVLFYWKRQWVRRNYRGTYLSNSFIYRLQDNSLATAMLSSRFSLKENIYENEHQRSLN
jgi:hypothetical protein